MSRVVGIDLSSFAVELVTLDETTNHCEWRHCQLHGSNALERLRYVPRAMPRWADGWWDDCYLVAIEAPYGTGQAGTLAKLSRVFGAVAACIPPRLQVWEVMPGTWRHELDLPGNAPKEICAVRAVELGARRNWADQNAFDAFAVAYAAREINDRGVKAA